MEQLRAEIVNIREKIEDIAVTLAKNTAILDRNTDDLAKHIRRTDLLEGKMEVALLPIRWLRVSAIVLGSLGTLATIGGVLYRIYRG